MSRSGVRVARAATVGAAVIAAAMALAACDRSPAAYWPHIEPVSLRDDGAYEVALAVRRDGIVAGWYDTRDGNAEIYLRRLDAGGIPAGPEWRVTYDDEDSYEVDLAPVGDDLAVAWYGKRSDDELVAWLALWREGSSFVWREALAPNARSSRNPVVRADGRGGILAAWIETGADGSEAVVARRFGADGRPSGAPLRLAPASHNAWIVNASVDELGIFYVTFDAQVDTQAEELYLVALDGDRVVGRRLTADDGHRSKYPDIAVERGRAALTWFDERDGQREVYLYIDDIDALLGGNGVPIDDRAVRVTHTAGPSIGAYLALNGDTVGLAWSDETDGPYQVYFQRFDLHGKPLTTALRLTDTPEESRIPAIRAYGDGFVMAWNEMVPAPSGRAHDPLARSRIVVTLVR